MSEQLPLLAESSYLW